MNEMDFNNKNSKYLSTKDKISAETFRLLREVGSQSITISQVCKAAEITKSTFYYYYHSIDEVIESFSDIIMLDLTDATPMILQQKSCIEQALMAIKVVDESVERLGVAVASSRYIMHLKKGDYMGFHTEAGWSLIVAIFKKAIELGEIPADRPAEKVAETVYYIMRGINHSWCMCGGSFAFTDRVQEELRRYLEFLAGSTRS